uniref:CR1-gamma n=1 Tax=Strongyloides papillosus TaxID=174720 RepID=A0A0N5CG42_STREA
MFIYNFILFLFILININLLVESESNDSVKPNNTYFFDLYNIYVLEHSAKDLWKCDDKVTIFIEKEIYVTSATCSKSSNIITLTCDSHKDAYQFVWLPSNTIKTFKIQMSVGNESFTGTFDGNMTNLMSPQIVLINPTNVNETKTVNSTDIEDNSFNAYIVFMIAPTNTILDKSLVKLSYINVILGIVIALAIITSLVILGFTIWKLAQNNPKWMEEQEFALKVAS